MKLNTIETDKPELTLAGLTQLTEKEAREYLERLLWPNGPTCPHCRSQRVTRVTRVAGTSGRAGLLMCNDCRKQFTVTVGTIFEDSHIPLRLWVMAFQMMCASKKGVSAKQVQRQLGLGSYKSAWFMCHRIRYAMENGPMVNLLRGTVECDETYVGGKPRPGTSFHKRGRGTKKTPVLALVERNGNVHSRVVANVSVKTLQGAIKERVDFNATMWCKSRQIYRGAAWGNPGGRATPQLVFTPRYYPSHYQHMISTIRRSQPTGSPRA